MAKKNGRLIYVYLPRSTVDVNTVIAVEVAAEAWGVSFGKALERMLEESKDFWATEKAVREKIDELWDEQNKKL